MVGGCTWMSSRIGENRIQFKLIFVPAISQMINLNRGIKYKTASANQSPTVPGLYHELLPFFGGFLILRFIKKKNKKKGH